MFQNGHFDHFGQNYLTILAETITKQFLGTFFVLIFVIITKSIPAEHFLCNVAATGLLLLQENMRRTLLCKEIFCNCY